MPPPRHLVPDLQKAVFRPAHQRANVMDNQYFHFQDLGFSVRINNILLLIQKLLRESVIQLSALAKT